MEDFLACLAVLFAGVAAIEIGFLLAKYEIFGAIAYYTAELFKILAQCLH